MILHNSDLSDIHEYIQKLKKVWGEQIITRQHSRRLDLIKAI